MRKSFKARLPVISAHARSADAAERQAFLRHMQQGVVHTHAAGHGALQHFVDLRFIFAEHI